MKEPLLKAHSRLFNRAADREIHVEIDISTARFATLSKQFANVLDVSEVGNTTNDE